MTVNKQDQIIMKGMLFHSHVGVLDFEKENGQTFEIDVILYSDRLAACESDNLAQTIDYGKAYEIIRQIMASARYDLIERLAGAIAEALLCAFNLAFAVELTVRKPQAPIKGRFSFMGVRIYRERS